MTGFAVTGWVLVLALLLAISVLRFRLELVARAEHELRGPLTALSLALEAMRRDSAEGDLADALDAQLDRARIALADLAAARGGERAADRAEQVPLDRFVRHHAAAWRPIADRAGRRLHVDWRAGSVSVSADRQRLAQVLGNLISNAVEHGEGSVQVLGRRDRNVVRLEITDRGPGFALERRVRRANRGRGLAIARRAAESNGGTLRALDADGRSGVVVELPVDDR